MLPEVEGLLGGGISMLPEVEGLKLCSEGNDVMLNHVCGSLVV